LIQWVNVTKHFAGKGSGKQNAIRFLQSLPGTAMHFKRKHLCRPGLHVAARLPELLIAGREYMLFILCGHYHSLKIVAIVMLSSVSSGIGCPSIVYTVPL
jgi:hypothetical protein